MTANAQTEYPELALKLVDIHGSELDAYLDGFWQRLDEISPEKGERDDDDC